MYIHKPNIWLMKAINRVSYRGEVALESLHLTFIV